MAPTDPTAIPAFAPAESEPPPADAAAAAPVPVAAAAPLLDLVPPVLAGDRDVVDDDDDDDPVASALVLAAAVTSYPSTQEMEPPAVSGMLAWRSRACSSLKRVALPSQSHAPRRSSEVEALVGTEQPAQGHTSASSSMASHRVTPTHSWSAKSSDFQGHELSVYSGSVHLDLKGSDQ